MSKFGYDRVVEVASESLRLNDATSAKMSHESYADMMKDHENNAKAMFRGVTMASTAAASFLLNRPGVGGGRVLAGLGTAFAANYAIDKMFFDDTHVRGGSMLGDLVAPLGIAAAPMPWKVKAPLIVAAHLGGRLIDKYA